MMRFGPFEFDPATHRLTQTGRSVHLTPKAFELLGLLIDAAPSVVSKNELHAQLWPRHAVSDATLVGLVKELRRALDDCDPACRMIRTVHRVGYAFDSPLELDPLPAPASGLLVIGRRRARLVEGDNLIGRDPACEVWIDNATVSRRHARIVVVGQQVALEDLGSKNGTRIGEESLAGPQALHDGDRIQFGEVDAVFRDTPSGQPTHTQADMTG
jgi:DNA-binding winged helix-turn-helix (wHTH) protein